MHLGSKLTWQHCCQPHLQRKGLRLPSTASPRFSPQQFDRSQLEEAKRLLEHSLVCRGPGLQGLGTEPPPSNVLLLTLISCLDQWDTDGDRDLRGARRWGGAVCFCLDPGRGGGLMGVMILKEGQVGVEV